MRKKMKKSKNESAYSHEKKRDTIIKHKEKKQQQQNAWEKNEKHI